MRLALFCLALGAIPMPGQVAAIAVYTQFQHPPSAAVVTSLEGEVDSIMSTLGLELEWRSMSAVRGNAISDELAVVTFKGTCDPRNLPPAPFRSGSLGWTHISDGMVLPFMDVDCDHIRGFLGAPLSRLGTEERNRVFGRAAGRVIAHELYHILGRTAHHGSGRVDSPAYTMQELVSDRLPLDAEGCRVLQLVNARALPPRGASVGSARKGQAKFVEKRCSVCHGSRGEGTRHAPSIRPPSQAFSAIALAAKLGIDSRAMCHRADQLKMVPPSVRPDDIADLQRFLNGPLY